MPYGRTGTSGQGLRILLTARERSENAKKGWERRRAMLDARRERLLQVASNFGFPDPDKAVKSAKRLAYKNLAEDQYTQNVIQILRIMGEKRA